MSSQPDPQFRWYRSLRVRIIVLISIVALPIGLIAVYQTSQLTRSAHENAKLALLALANDAIQENRNKVQRAFGAATMLAGLSDFLRQNPASCPEIFSNYLAQEPDFSFVGIIEPDGMLNCSSIDTQLDFSGYETWPDLAANPRKNVVVNRAAPGSRESVIVASVPIDDDGAFNGYVSVSIPHRRLTEQPAFAVLPQNGLIELVTINRLAEVVTAEVDIDAANQYLPQDIDSAWFDINEPISFTAPSRNGATYFYTVAANSIGDMTSVGIWDPDGFATAKMPIAGVPASLFPGLMWIATVLMSIMALYTLVIRHVSRLRRQMIDFATTRKMPAVRFDSAVPNELVDMQMHFVDMVDNILREEARLESMVREQNVLAKEVHHRVKNNLQMITSIMNMQIRSAQHDETVTTLRKVQDRIKSLAGVHEDLASSVDEGRVNVGSLIYRTVQSSIELGVDNLNEIDLHKDLDDLWLYPDQGVALSLLANEAITNAIKYMAATADEKPKLSVSLKQTGQIAEFVVQNSMDPEVPKDQGTGIGSKLISAFGIKLGAKIEKSNDAQFYTLQMTFPIEDYLPPGQDY